MWYLYSFVSVFVVIFLVSLVATTLTASLEKRLVWPYVPEADAPPDRLPPPNSYAMVAGSAATEAGFLYVGTFAGGKGKLYRMRYDFLLSPTGDTLVLIGTGTIASLTVRATRLFTLLTDGGYVITVDKPTEAEPDLAGLADTALAAEVGFFVLLTTHRARVALKSSQVKTFSMINPLADLRTCLENRTQRMKTLGYASFLDSTNTWWRYTIEGALILAFRQSFSSLRRSFIPDKAAVPGQKMW